MGHPKTERRTHWAALDAIRGGCALWVLGGHVALVAGFFGHYSLLDQPAVAVDVFMFLSGFLMTDHYYQREMAEPWEDSATWRKFYVRRFFRIAPLYYLVLVIALVFQDNYVGWYRQIISVFPDPLLAWLGPTAQMPAVSWANLFSHFLFLFGFIPAYAASNVLPDWSIGLEMQFYLAFPFIMLLYRRRGIIFATALLLGCWYLSNQLFSVYADGPPKPLGNFPQPSFLPLKLNCFIIGILLAEALRRRGSNPGGASVLILLSVIVATISSASAYFLLPVYGGTALLWCQDGVLAQTRLAAVSNRLLRRKLFPFLADMAYGAYLLHLLILVPVAAYLSEFSFYVSLRATERFALLLALMLALVYSLAFVTHKFIEQPGIKLGRRFL
jgi:peptidoglycan/LPS O-acetylase OafA/YrhL